MLLIGHGMCQAKCKIDKEDCVCTLSKTNVMSVKCDETKTVLSDFPKLNALQKEVYKHQLIIENKVYSKIPDWSFKNISFANHSFLKLVNLNLENIERNAFYGILGVTDLNLNTNKLKNFSSNYLSTLKLLDLSHNEINVLTSQMFAHLKELTSLRLEDNKIDSIELKAFEGLDILKHLYLSLNNIKQFNKNSFIELSKLNILDLDQNYIKSIEEGQLNGLDSLNHMSLKFNEFNQVKKKSFAKLFSLAFLDFSNQNIVDLEANFLTGLNKLSYLYLNDNSLILIKNGTFIGLTKLDELKLNRNKISILEKEAFQDLISLKTLDLSSNELTSLNNGTFSGLVNLANLILRDNELFRIEADTYIGLGNSLINLDLTENYFQFMKLKIFKNFTKIKNFKFRKNQISSIDYSSIAFLKSMHELDLSENSLFRFELNSDLPYLEILFLEWNVIKSVSQETFNHVYNLTELYLRGNELDFLPSKVFFRLSKLKLLDLSFNKLKTIHMLCFDGLDFLEGLNLNNNYNAQNIIYAANFSSESFKLSKVQNLHLSNTPMKLIKKFSIGTRFILKELDLSFNDLDQEIVTQISQSLNRASLNYIVLSNFLSSINMKRVNF